LSVRQNVRRQTVRSANCLSAKCPATAGDKEIDKEIMFLHSFATEKICSASIVVKNVQLLSDFSLTARKNKD
jgi:hypothetical protein